MKNLNIKYNILYLSAITCISVGCSEDLYDGEYKPSLKSHYLKVSQNEFVFNNNEETKTGSITSENSWSFTNIPSWLSISPSSGDYDAEFSITAKKNDSIYSREAIFYISAKYPDYNIRRVLTASQKEGSPYITFPQYSSSSIEIEGQSNNLTIDVNTNIPDLVATFSEEWAEASYNSEAKTINIEIQPNETDFSRNGNIIVTSKEYNKTALLTILQQASEVSVVEGNDMNFDADGGNQTRIISSDLPWSAKTTYPWIDFSPKSGDAGETTMTITTLPSYDAKERIGQIYFYFGEAQKSYIGITQTGRYINISEKSIVLSSDEGSEAKVDIDSNIDWEISSSPEWLVINDLQGNAGSSILTITASKNNSLKSRSGTIIVTDSKTGGIQTKLTVTQNGLDFGDNTILEFSWHQSSLALDIPLPGEWTAAVSDEWITLSDYSGNGNMTIDISVLKNEGEDPRSGKILVLSEGKTFEIAVVQDGQYIKLDNTLGEISAVGGKLTLSVASSINTVWKIEDVSTTDEWISVDDTNNNEYIINVDYNPSIVNRTATFVLYPTDDDVSEGNAQGIKFFIKQFGRTISCDVSKIEMLSGGGTSQTYKISADGNYSINKGAGDNWFSIVHDSATNTYYTVVTSNNSDENRVGHIVLSLSNLPNGENLSQEIEVIQYKKGINILFDNFEEEKIW